MLLRPLTEKELRVLFAGPDRIFHLREDAARELHRRTDGIASRVSDEVRAWVRARLARWEDGLLVLDRATIDRLRVGLVLSPASIRSVAPTAHLDPALEDLLAWIQLCSPHAKPELLARVSGLPRWRIDAGVDELARRSAVRALPSGHIEPRVAARALQTWSSEVLAEAHWAIARELEPASPGRLLHLIASGNPRAIVDEACATARARAQEGRVGEAIAALREGLISVRTHGDGVGELDLLEERTRVAFTHYTAQALELLDLDLQHSELSPDTLNPLKRLVEAGKIVMRGDGKCALERLEEMAPFADVALELRRHALRVLAARYCPVEVEERVLRDIEAWATTRESDEHARIDANLDSWRGRLLYRKGRFREAAEHHLRATEDQPASSAFVNDLLTAALSHRFSDASGLQSFQRTDNAGIRCRHQRVRL